MHAIQRSGNRRTVHSHGRDSTTSAEIDNSAESFVLSQTRRQHHNAVRGGKFRQPESGHRLAESLFKSCFFGRESWVQCVCVIKRIKNIAPIHGAI